MIYFADPNDCLANNVANMALGNGQGLMPPPVMVPSSARSLASSGTCYLDTDRQAPYEPLQMMKAIHVENFGGPEVLQLKHNLIIPPLTKSQVLDTPHFCLALFVIGCKVMQGVCQVPVRVNCS